MRVIDLDTLEYLHDAVVDRIAFDPSERDRRTLRFHVRVHEDAGYEPWDGKRVTISFVDATCVIASFLGSARLETINSCSEGASRYVQEEFPDLAGLGIASPRTRLGLSFASGSEMEIVCEEVDVEVEDS